MNISQPTGRTQPKLIFEASFGLGLIALDFGPGRIGTLVSMATNSSHKVIMGKML